MKILLKVINVIINVFIVAISICLLFAIYNFFQLNILKRQYTNYFGYTYFEILTGSMENEIQVNDYVFVKITKDVKENDVISFVNGDEVITHRILHINENEIVTKGDNNNTEDDAIDIDQVIGNVVYIGRGYGKYIKIIREPLVFIPFMASIIFLNLVITDDKKRGEANEKI